MAITLIKGDRFMADNMISCENVFFRYESMEGQTEKVAVAGVDLEVKKGEFLVILNTMDQENLQLLNI